MSGSIQVGVDCQWLGPNPGGVGNYISQLLLDLAQQAPDLHFVLYSDRAIPDALRGVGHCVEHLGPRLPKPLWLATTLPPRLRADQPAVFWGTHGFLPLRRLPGMATVVTVHDLVHRMAPATTTAWMRWRQRLLQPRAVHAADRVTANSFATAQEVELHYGRRPDLVVHPCLDPAFSLRGSAEALADVRRRHGLPQDFLLALGTLEPRKNMAALLTAYASLRDAGHALPLLVLAGKPGWGGSGLRQQVDRLVGQGRVRWLGYVPQPDLPALYAASALFVFVPLYEGFGMPVREALLAGARVMASDLAVLREAGGEWPCYVGTDAPAIADGLLRCLAPTAVAAGVARRLPAGAWPGRRAATTADFAQLIRDAAAAGRRAG